MATVLSIWFPRYRVAFYIIAGFIGWSRIYSGLHFPTDVVAGAIMGYGITKIFLNWIPGLDIKFHYFRDEKGSSI
jgi:membrane-associated phospholipid phosphatase